MTALFNRIFSAATGWAILRFLGVCLVIYMAWGFLYPLASRAGGTAKYVVTQMPGEAGNWIANKIGLKGGGVTKTSNTTTPPPAPGDQIFTPPALGGPPTTTSVALAQQERELERKAEELKFQSKRAGIWSKTLAQGESLERALTSGTPNPARIVSVTVFAQPVSGGNVTQVAAPHTVIIDQDGEQQETAVSPNSTLDVKVGYGPIHFKVIAKVPGYGLSEPKVVDFSTDETGSKKIQLLVQN